MKFKGISLLALLFVLLVVLVACAPHEHTWEEASCAAPKTCSVCGATEGEALPHTEEIMPSKEATCKEAGLTEGKKCSVCEAIIVAQNEIEKLAHIEAIVEGTPADCDNDGITDGKKCVICGDVTMPQETIPATGHNHELVETVNSTCTVAGKKIYKCTACDDSYAEPLALASHTSAAAVEENRVDSTCTVAGHYDSVVYCSVCKTHEISRTKVNLALAAHTPGDAATCTSVQECTVCHTELAAKLPHSEKILEAKEPTCTESGLTEGKQCSVCKAITVAQETIPANNHKDDNNDYKCDVCKVQLCTEHTAGEAKQENVKEASCTAEGSYESVVQCTKCGFEISRETKTIPKVAHTPGAAATCTTAQECTVCHTELAEAKGHTPGAAATCTAIQECTVCHAELAKAKGHAWGSGATANGITTYTCNNCGVIKAESANFENKDNIFTDKEFVGTDEANAQVLPQSSWFQGGGYEVLTDGSKAQESAGRFSTLLNNTTAFMDATIDLGEKYTLNVLRFYIYETKASITEQNKKDSIGKDMLIQVYIDGKWYDVVNCADNASLCEYLTITDGYNNDYLEFNLGGIVAEKIRFYISGAVTKSGITYQEIECSGALLNAHVHTEEALAASPATCVKPGLTAGVWCPVCEEILKAQEVIPAKGHTWGSGVTANGITTYTCQTCGLAKAKSESFTTVDNLFDGKEFVPSSDAANNKYSASYGYATITDGIIYQESSGRYSSLMNGGKVEATIDLGAVYALSEFKIYLYKSGISHVGTGLVVEVLVGNTWIPVVNCETADDLQKYWVDNPDSTTMDWLVFDFDGAKASSVKFTIPGQASSGWTTFYEIECSGALLNEHAHTKEVIKGTPATCTKAGLTDGEKCSECGAILVAQEEIPATGHKDADKNHVCDNGCGIEQGKHEAASGQHTCSYCNAKVTDCADTNPKDHKCDVCGTKVSECTGADAVKENEVSATCTTNGSYNKVVYCSVCKAKISTTAVTVPAGHSFVDGACSKCGIVNVFYGKEFVPSSDAANNKYNDSTGYQTITDGIIYQESSGRFSSKKNGGLVQATLDLGGVYELSELRIYLYWQGLTSLGTDFKLEVLLGSEWTTVVNCTAAELSAYLVQNINDTVNGTNFDDKDMLAFNLNNVCANQVRFTISGQEASSGWTTFYEMECSGKAKNLFVGNTITPSSDASSNIYSASYPYANLIDGDLASRYSSKQNGGKVEATIDLGGVYDLSEFKILLYGYNSSGFTQFGTGLQIQTLFGGTWTKVIDCTDADFADHVVVTGDQNWLVFDLGGVSASKVKFTIPSHGSSGWSTMWEIHCSGNVSSAVEPDVPVLIDNVFANKTFTPTEEALASVLTASWWKGSGYAGLTDGIKNADNATGRFATVMATTGMMDSTIDLGGSYELHSLKFYTYDPAAGTTAGSLGANLLIQVYANGKWTDVINCANNESIAGYLVVNSGTYNDYLEFNLNGVTAEKVRFYISESASASGTSFEEIECTGYAK